MRNGIYTWADCIRSNVVIPFRDRVWLLEYSNQGNNELGCNRYLLYPYFKNQEHTQYCLLSMVCVSTPWPNSHWNQQSLRPRSVNEHGTLDYSWKMFPLTYIIQSIFTGGINFPTPWLWAGPCNLLWPMIVDSWGMFEWWVIPTCTLAITWEEYALGGQWPFSLGPGLRPVKWEHSSNVHIREWAYI